MLNYSYSNSVDTHLKKKLVKSISQPPIKDNRFIDNAEKNCDNFEFSHDELNDIVVNSTCQPLLVCFQAETAESSNEKTSALLKGSWYSATYRINPAP